MRKSYIFTLFLGILIGGLGFCFADYDTAFLMDKITNFSCFPALREKFGSMMSCSDQKPPYKQYGNLQLMESLDDGRMRPKQRRKMWHNYLDKIAKQVHSFPSPAKKLNRIKNLQKRVNVLEEKYHGRKRV